MTAPPAGALPPLPEPDFLSGNCNVGESAYTADQMREYALLAALRLREGCAELVARIEREADAHTYFADNADLRMTTGDHAKRAVQLTTIRDDLARVLEQTK